jgi:hypothetical protein
VLRLFSIRPSGFKKFFFQKLAPAPNGVAPRDDDDLPDFKVPRSK